MNAGTAVFLIVLVLIGSFAGLGYLVNQNITAVEEREAAQTHSSALEAENARLQQLLATCQSDRTTCEQTSNSCQVENTGLRQQVRAVTLERDQAVFALNQCQQSSSAPTSPQAPVDPQPTAPTTQSGSGSNTITWLMLATVFITMVTGWGVVLRTVRLSQQEGSPRPQPASRQPTSEQPLTVRMTREQMQAYVTWKRQQK